MKIGVLALQGAFIEHIKILDELGAEAAEVRKPADLKGCDALIIPGGESTAIAKLMKDSRLDKEIIKMAKKGMPILGTCAGAILLSKKVQGEKRYKPLGLVGIEMQRNAYGRQAESFESELEIKGMGGKFKGVFIRAPVIETVLNGAEILSETGGKAVLLKKGKILISTFHPELANDKRVHEYFISLI